MYSELYFPFQAMLMLSKQGQDFSGGEFILMEQRPRMQSRAIVLQPARDRLCYLRPSSGPIKGRRDTTHIGLRHGLSEVKSGQRMTLGLIFQDAR